MGENPKIACPNCGEQIVIILNEFVDVATDPVYKEKILTGDFFTVKCPKCGDETIIEYPMMYIDPEKKLNIYMSPEQDDQLLEQLNSLTVPDSDIDAESKFRLVANSAQLIEQITMAEAGRDDRILQAYKMIICENSKEEMPGMASTDLFYTRDLDEEFFVLWPMGNDEGDQLTLGLDPKLYDELAVDLGELLETEPNKYVRIDDDWITKRIEITE